jgi:hypothetical protein
MSQTAAQPATPPMPVQLAESECTALLLPHLSLPQRGPKCTRGYDRVLHRILWLLYPGMQGKCLPVPTDADGKPAIHSTTVYTVFATWAADGALWQALIARGRHLAVEKHLDTRVLHGDGTNPVAKKGALAWATRATNTRKGRKLSRSRITRATCERQSPWRLSTRLTWGYSRRACTPGKGWSKRWGGISTGPTSTSLAVLILPTIAHALSMRA